MPWRSPPISLEYFDLMLRREYLAGIREVLNQPSRLLQAAKGDR